MPTTVLESRLGDRLLRDEPLAKYTAARLGGPADWVYIARESIEELVEVVTEAWAQDIDVRVLGGGANVLVSDRGFRGLVVINKVAEINFGAWHDGRTVSASSGTSLTALCNRCQTHGYTGMEWAVSVPGTVGGAAVNNAGAHGACIADSIVDVVVLEADRGPQLYSNAEMEYDYRYSVLKARLDRRYLVLLATFALQHADPDAIRARMAEFNTYRKSTQPAGASLGSIFKNPPGDYAGRLIESAGLKGYRVGNVVISPVHANFFINIGEASASDYRSLVEHVQRVVEAASGIRLEPEIEFVGDWT